MTIVSLLNKHCVIYTYIHTYMHMYIQSRVIVRLALSVHTHPLNFTPCLFPPALYNLSTFVHCWLYHYFNKQIASQHRIYSYLTPLNYLESLRHASSLSLPLFLPHLLNFLFCVVPRLVAYNRACHVRTSSVFFFWPRYRHQRSIETRAIKNSPFP